MGAPEDAVARRAERSGGSRLHFEAGSKGRVGRAAARVEPYALPAACVVAAAAAVALCLPAVWNAPLNVDEEVTMAISTRPLGEVWSIVWGDRGGGPLHFFLEHLTLQWPGGLVGLRVPSLVFFVLALPAAALLARELAGRWTAVVAVLLLGAAPLAVSHGTFGRPHVMLMAWFGWALWAALRGARTGSRAWWLAGGLALGTSVLVHPIAPVYAGAGALAAVIYAPRPLRAVVREAWPGALAFLLVLVPYYAHSLRVLGARYEVGSGARGRTYSGNSVLHDALTGVAPSAHVLNLFTVAALGGALALLRRRARAALVALVVVAAPILFFSLVPSGGRSALFFTRYMLPALPLFLTLVAVGILAVAGVVPRAPWLAAALIVAAFAFTEARADVRRTRDVASLRLGDLVDAVRGRDAILFGSVGTIGPGTLAKLSYGRPPTLLDRYLLLRLPALHRVDDHSCVPAVRFLRVGGAPRRGLWVFYGASDDEVAAGERVLPQPRLVARRYLLVESRPLVPRALLEEGARLRRVWLKAVPRDAKADYHIRADETALRAPGTCTPLGEFGDPDITPARKIPKPVD
jgi:hypothetical protein